MSSPEREIEFTSISNVFRFNGLPDSLILAAFESISTTSKGIASSLSLAAAVCDDSSATDGMGLAEMALKETILQATTVLTILAVFIVSFRTVQRFPETVLRCRQRSQATACSLAW